MSDAPAHHPGGLTETELGLDPVARLVAWLDEARKAGVRFPEAAALATADAVTLSLLEPAVEMGSTGDRTTAGSRR